ncbi:tryptophan-rich antigen [Plasmodium cynomolgi strain B]|uniref:Tryptophan-rich antigen n=1 Tax=Plasmodium cynomolgi (strain B) TaxID=1120755 RepID=K6UTS7_PLACD|nr:tryptophan-rich antigen [Plasmodium cynomolgi strain B]GAB66749.1 tryptophan-rich antigen [Plasmodium cynomolgi strain B]
MQLEIPKKDELDSGIISILDVDYQDIPKEYVEEETAVYPLKPEDYAKEDLQSTEWITFTQSLEDDWERLEVILNKAKERWMQQTNKEWSSWIHLIEDKWSIYSLRKRDWSDEKWKKWFRTEVKSQIDSEVKKWMNDTNNNLFKILAKDMLQFQNKKIKEWLMYHWKNNEGGSVPFGLMTTSKILKLIKSKEWYRTNPIINMQRRELMKWFILKENEYLKREWRNWTYWKKVKFFVINSICTTLSRKRLTEEEWNQFINDIKV